MKSFILCNFINFNFFEEGIIKNLRIVAVNIDRTSRYIPLEAQYNRFRGQRGIDIWTDFILLFLSDK